MIRPTIPKISLIVNKWYWGIHRCCRLARWTGAKFIFIRYGNFPGDFFIDSARHPEDDDGAALFEPKEMVGGGLTPEEEGMLG